MIGVITLRFLAGLFVELLAKFTYLQDAAYLTVLAVGMRLLFKACLATASGRVKSSTLERRTRRAFSPDGALFYTYLGFTP
jgi:predicted tellurium resistance membrane protein TerC